ncbi:hypothetical protein JCM10213_002868 [Rhodosporidiobolus nylandii]
MAPFPTRRHARNPSNSLLPTIHSVPPPAAASSASLTSLKTSVSSTHSYPPAPSPSVSPRASFASSAGARVDADAGSDPRQMFGGVAHPTAGQTGGLGGITDESRETVRRCLEENHIRSHTFFNDKGFHNHCAHHLLAAYSMGGTPQLLEDILKLHHETAFKPMPPMVPVEITEANWTEHLGDERFYPNYLKFFHRLIKMPPPPTSPYFAKGHKTSTVPVLEHYLFGGHGEMLIRAVSGAIHPLIHIGHGIEFKLDAVVAEGLAQCAVHEARTGNLFPSSELGTTWPPQPPKPSSFQASLSSAFSSLRFPSFSSSPPPSAASAAASYLPPPTHPIASGSDSFAKTAAALPRDTDERRYPREGLSGFTILDRILHDEALAPGRACSVDDMPKLDAVLQNQEAAARLRGWCDEWKFSTQASEGWEDSAGRDSDEESDGQEVERRRRAVRKGKMKGYGVPSWGEIVQKYEELVWMATVCYAAGTRPGYKKTKLDFFIMHGLTSVLFLPPILEVISPHLRPYLLVSHFRILLAYWVSRGRPPLYVTDTLMAASARPVPPPPNNQPEEGGTAVSRALHDAERTHREEHDPHEGSRPASRTPSRAASPAPSHDPLQQEVHNDGYVESPLTPKAADGKPLPFAEGGEGIAAAAEETMRGLEEGSNPWMRVLQSAVDHDDEHVTKAVRSLYFAATHFGASPKGMYPSSLPGTNEMDGSIFIRAAGMTLDSVGWAHEGAEGNVGTWDRSGLGWPETWSKDELLPGREWPPASFSGKGKARASVPHSASNNSISPSNSPYTPSSPYFTSPPSSARSSTRSFSRTRSGTVVPGDEEAVSFAARDSALLSPRLASSTSFGGGGNGGGRGSPSGGSPYGSRAASPVVSPRASIESRPGWRKVGEQVSEEEERERRERLKREEEERELMA